MGAERERALSLVLDAVVDGTLDRTLEQLAADDVRSGPDPAWAGSLQLLSLLLSSRWDDAVAVRLDPVERLIYRSNLLGADARITNTGGGNTSSKLVAAEAKRPASR